jgi:type IV pilus assembly PilX-like protein
MPMTRIDPSSERGVAMIVVLMVLIAGTMLGTVALSAAGADMPFARDSQDRKQAYAAAEAGIEYYLYQLSQDNDYWTKCQTGAAPNPGEPNPVVQRWIKSNGADTRIDHWRKVPGAKAEYAIELMPAASNGKCVANDGGASMLDQASGTFRIRSTGRINGQVRSIVTTLRRKSFLDYLYFTNFETHDPAVYSTQGWRDWAAANCQQMRDDRPSSCTDITFRSDDAINGPFHTNDDILTCGGTTLGRTKADAIEISGPHAPGWKNNSGCTGSPNIKGTLQSGAEPLEIPPTSTNSELAAAAVPPYRYTGKTFIELTGNTMKVKTNGASSWSSVAQPSNGVIYVDNGACSGVTTPALARYNESSGCGNVYVHGTYSKNLTIASANDIIVDGDLTMVASSDSVLGLIADNFVRVQHKVTRSDWSDIDSCTNDSSGTMTNVTIEAAILALKHSFIVDNYSCGAGLGTLTVKGAIAQRFRGVVGTFTPTGYLKSYNYDDRLRYRSPPFFIDPVSASWKVIRTNEQVPAWK